jgi:hypothetical protein
VALPHRCRSRRGGDEDLVRVEVAIAAYLMEPSTLKGSLGSEVALVGVGDDSGNSMIGRDV